MRLIAIYHHVKHLMSGFRENVQNPKFLTLNRLISRLRFLFKISAVSLLFTLLTLNFMQSFRKTNELSLRYLKTDRRTEGQIDGQGRLSPFLGKLRKGD